MTAESGSTTAYTIDEVATKLSLTPDQVRDLIAAGALRATGSGDDARVPPDSLLIYMSSRLSAHLKQHTTRQSGLAVTCSALLPLVLLLWFMALCAEIFTLRDHKPIVSAPIAAIILAALLALAWLLARTADDLSSTNGMGTSLYGKQMTPDGRVGTAWVILVGIPLLPLKSYVILEEGEDKANWSGMIRKRNYMLRPLGGIYWPQAALILAGVWIGLGALFAAIVLL